MTEVPTPSNPDAYELLSRPTLDLTDAEVELVVADLRRRRAAFIASGKPDKPRKEVKAKAEPLSAEAKKQNTAALLSMLKIK